MEGSSVGFGGNVSSFGGKWKWGKWEFFWGGMEGVLFAIGRI